MRNQDEARKVVGAMLQQALKYYQVRGFKIQHAPRPHGEEHPFFNIDYQKKTLVVFANKQDHTEVLRFKLISHMVKESFPPRLRERFASKKS